MRKRIFAMLFVLGMMWMFLPQDAAAAEPIVLTEEMFRIDTLPAKYDGEEIEKTVVSDTLIAGVDYTVDYEDNINAGTATIRISGMGEYTGEITKEFTIEKADRVFRPMATASLLYTASNSDVINITYDNASEEENPVYHFTSSDRSIVYVSGSDNRLIAGKTEGSAKITVEAEETANYAGSSMDIELTVKNVDIIVKDSVGGHIVLSVEEAYYGQKVLIDFVSEEDYRPRDIDARDNNGEMVDLHYEDDDTMFFYAPNSDVTITTQFEHISEWEKVKIELTYLYINEDGDNSLYVDTQYVYTGTTWGEFFETYEKWYENGTITDVAADVTWDEVSVQNWIYSNIEDCYSDGVQNFNAYSDCAMVTFYGYPTETYKHGYFSFEYLVDGKYKNSGTGWDLLVPKAHVYGSEEAIEYATRNIPIHSYIYDLCNTPGATVTVETTVPVEQVGLWNGYNIKIVAPPVTEIFADVKDGEWYTNAVQYVCENGLMVGKAADRFDVAGNLTRAEFATILYKIAGKPQVTTDKTFADVKDGDWFKAPVYWLAKQGIAAGYPNGKFGVADPITREDLALMLYKYSEGTALDNAMLKNFNDADKISNYAVEAVTWAVENGIISGTGEGNINPKGSATRAEAAAMITKFMN